MVKFTKYLSICVILASSRFIGASKLPAEDCDDGKETGSDYFASGSAHSSQFLMPDGSVLTNSKGSSVSSDGIQRTFHELKKEANKYVSKTSSDGLTVPSGAIIPEIPGSEFSSFFKKNGAFSAGEHSSFSSSQSGSGGSSQYFDQQHVSQFPADSKITTFKKQEVKKVVTKSSSGSSSNPEVAGEFDVEQNIGSNANANKLFYQPAGTVQNGYSSNHHQESGSFKVSSSNVNPVPDTAHQTIYYRPTPLKLYEREDNDGSEGIKVSGTKVNNPSTFGGYGGKTIVYSSVPHSDAISSSSVSKVESYSQRQHNANADIPSYLITKPNTYTDNVVNLDNIGNIDVQYIPGHITTSSPIAAAFTENHYASESHEQKETKHYAVPVVPKTPTHTYNNEEVESYRPESDSNGNKPVIVSSEKIVAPDTDSRHTRFKIKVQAPTGTAGSSQTYRKETHSQSVKTFASDSGVSSADLSEPDVHKNEDIAKPVSLSALQSQGGEYFGKNAQKSGDAVQIPILLQGVPQNTAFYSSKSGSSSSGSFSSGSQFGSSFDTGSLFGNSDKFSIPVQTYVSPVQTYVSPVQTYVSPQSSSKSSSSSSYHYFSSNGKSGEQLVPNSNIFANSDGSSFHQGHASLLQNLGKSNIGSDSEFVLSSSGTPQKKTYGFSTAYSSHSSNVNGKVTENREASVAVNDNGKIDSYHVKS